MKKYVFMNYWEGYQGCILNAIKDDMETYYFHPIKNRVLRLLFRIHNAWPLNAKKELPLKRIWFNRCLKSVELLEDDEIYFILYEMFHMTFSKSFLKYLHSTYQNAKLCFVFSNPIDEYNQKKLNTIKKELDYIITFNEKDAEQQSYLYCPLQPYKVSIYKSDPTCRSDLFFIGSDKGRLNKLLLIYEKATSAGYKCEFFITDVPEERQKYADSIIYNQRLSYEEVLQKVASTKCVLEILQNDQDYISIRTIEAMEYHKKLLTDNLTIKTFAFYNAAQIQIIEDVHKLNIDFLENELNGESYVGADFCSLNSFKAYLSECVK